jgi:[ribosomal protein S5]-alanine N-acetyltransferase
MKAPIAWPEPPALIEGVRLRLRRARPDDAAALFALVDDAAVMRFLDWPRPGSVADTLAHLRAVDERWQRGLEHQYLVLRKPDGVALGSLAFRPRAHSADFGFFFGRAHWGQGFGSEAAALLVGWLRRQPALVRLWATCDVDNRASARVLEKAGLQREALMRRASVRPNLDHAIRDTALYAWVRDEETPS